MAGRDTFGFLGCLLCVAVFVTDLDDGTMLGMQSFWSGETL